MTRAEVLALLSARIAAIPDALEAVPAAVRRAPLAGGARELVTTGVGLSEGPARLLAALAREAGRRARFVPLSIFARPSPAVPVDVELVIVSQGLSPNARMALRHATAFEVPPLLVTSVADADARGARSLVLPPPREDELFFRVIGPAAAAYAAVCLVYPELAGQHHDDVKAAFGRPAEASVGDELASGRALALVTAEEGDGDLAFSLRWKLLESLRVSDPPVWDVLQLAHGPAQAAWSTPLTLVALEREGDGAARALFDALEGARSPAHALVRLRARLPGPLALLEWDAALDHALLSALARLEIALDRWPTTSVDAALYRIDAPLE